LFRPVIKTIFSIVDKNEIQSNKSREGARRLETDDYEERFDKKLGKLVKQKPYEKSAG